ncbi:MAG: pyridoxal phosphate-dependent aminotransferase [Candidatus Omnitrophica bacterium]|nr:pyridoxal phosphate-dependent aminotransferase [Candidatus Omnitrophota bacterium]
MSLSKRISQIQPSATLGITSKARAMAKQGIDVISFGAGEPDFDTPDYIKQAGLDAIKAGKTKYTQSAGTLELRQAICDKLSSIDKIDYTPKDIIVSNGAKHSLYNIFQAICDKGDEVITVAPYWVSYVEMIRLAEAIPVILRPAEGEGFKITAESLAGAITSKTKAVIINSPSNPSGCLYTRDELYDIVCLLKGKGIRVISDEIYNRLVYDGLKAVSCASLGREGKDMTVIVNGVSKTYAMTGWRIGYIASNDTSLTSAIANLQDHSSSNPCSISQEAALAAISSDESSVSMMRDEFKKRRDYMVKRIKAMKSVSCLEPKGAFYCFVNVSVIGHDTLKIADRLLEDARVAVVPGEGFGCPGYIRLSFATSMKLIKEGLDRIEKWLKQ